MTDQQYDLTLTRAELEAVEGWAGAAAVGFHYGPEAPDEEKDPSVTALAKVQKALGREESI